MIPSSEIQQRFKSIEQAIGQASRTCQAEAGTPPQIKDAIEQLDRRSNMARDAISSNDTSRMREAVDDLEMLGDEAKRACRDASAVPQQLQEAVLKVHDQLSDLKHQLH